MGIIPARLVAQMMLRLELADAEGGVDLGSGEVAARVTEQAEANAGDALLAEAGFHLDAMPEEVLGEVPNGLAPLDGGGDDGVQGGVQVGYLKLWGCDLWKRNLHVLGPVLVAGDLLEAQFLLQAAADLLGGEAVATSVDALPVKIDGRHGDVEVLLAAVVMFHSQEGAVLIAQPTDGLLHLVAGLLGGHPFPEGMADDEVDHLMLQRIQPVHQGELPGEFFGVPPDHVGVDQGGIGLGEVAEAVARR
jgi:hypothetical protein